MKNILYILICLSISQLMYSQNCEKISPYKEGMSLEYENYNKKGKVKSVESHFVESVTNEGGNLTIKIKSKDSKKGNPSRVYTLKCVSGGFYVDMANYTSLKEENGKESLKVKATGDFLEFPENIAKGTDLRDGDINIEIGSQEAFAAIASMKVFNRKVLENDSFTIKAGTFKGYKVSFDYVFNIGIIKFKGSGIEWYVKGIGIVKTENYSKTGKLRSSRELTKIENQ